MINVQEFLKTHSLEELNRSAEEYFAGITDWTYLLAKPFAAPDDCAKLLIEFWAALLGLEVAGQMEVLDFGPGSCWTSHFLTQMGCKVYACDISRSALEVGRKRYREHVPFGSPPAPEFLVFDGFHIPLPDQSVDRVLCMHALHHVPNVVRVIGEMFRVLGDTGIAAFVEPGPDHSQSPDSQHELANGVLENDIVIEDIWDSARDAGFRRLELTAFPIERPRLSFAEYRRFLGGDSEVDGRILAPIRRHAAATRTFFLYKEAEPVLWSTAIQGLAAELEVRVAATTVGRGQIIRADLRVKNTGQANWLQAGDRAGVVRLGFHLKDVFSGEYFHDYGRAPLSQSGHPIRPGEELRFPIEVRAPGPGNYELTFDLVSERICWFAERNCSRAVVFRITVT
jgi:SAM-dependent methyltransferase